MSSGDVKHQQLFSDYLYSSNIDSRLGVILSRCFPILFQCFKNVHKIVIDKKQNKAISQLNTSSSQ